MSFASPSQTAPARRSRRAPWHRGSLALLLALFAGAALLSGVAAAAQAEAPAPQEHAAAPAAAPQEHGAPATAPQEHGATAAGEHAAGEEEHVEGPLPMIARVFNFAVLAGLLFYF